MTDSEIMLELVKLKILNAREMSWHLIDHVGDVIAVFTDARLAVQDWRVAGAMLNEVRGNSVESWCKICKDMMHLADAGPLARAIIEACVEALSD